MNNENVVLNNAAFKLLVKLRNVKTGEVWH